MAKFEKREVFKTEATARQHRPAAPTDKAGAPKPNRSRLWRVTSPDGTVRFVWSVGRAGALFQAARADDYKIEALDAKPIAPPSMAAAMTACICLISSSVAARFWQSSPIT